MLHLTLCADALAYETGVDQKRIDPERLTFTAPFSAKRRGVETRLIMSATTAKSDTTLITNIARAHAWLNRIKTGDTIRDIASYEYTSAKRVQETLEYAFLAPDIVRDVLAGNQPLGLTSTWIATHKIPACWSDQRALFATL